MSLPLHYYRVAVLREAFENDDILELVQNIITEGLQGRIVDGSEFENNVPNSFIARVLDDDVKDMEKDPRIVTVTKVKNDPRFA